MFNLKIQIFDKNVLIYIYIYFFCKNNCRPPFWEHFLFEFVAAYLARWSISRRPRVNPWLAIMESEQCFWKPIRDWHLARRNLQKLQVVEEQRQLQGGAFLGSKPLEIFWVERRQLHWEWERKEEQAGEEQRALERRSEEETEHVSEERRQDIFQSSLRGERSLEGEKSEKKRGQGGEFLGGASERENEGEGEKEDFWRATREEGDDSQRRKKKGDSGGRRLQTEWGRDLKRKKKRVFTEFLFIWLERTTLSAFVIAAQVRIYSYFAHSLYMLYFSYCAWSIWVFIDSLIDCHISFSLLVETRL